MGTAYARQLSAAQRAYDNACDCCDGRHEPEPRPAFRIHPDDRRALRVMKGRPEYRTTYQQFDQSKRRMLPATVAPDPILDLYVARRSANLGPRYAVAYGELRQRVTSPVSIPGGVA